jgi:acyl-CoA thioesterase I
VFSFARASPALRAARCTASRRKGAAASAGGNVATIVARLNVRGIKVIMLERPLAGMAEALRHPDGQHLSAEGYRALAARVLPQVTAAIGR